MDYGFMLMQITALVISGIAYALLGSVKAPLSKQLAIGETGVGGLMSMFGLTIIPMALIAGILNDLLGRQLIVSSGFILIMVSLIVLANSKNMKLALVSVFIFGTGWAAVINVLNVASPIAFVAVENRTKDTAHFAMNLGDFIFGVGAFVAPLLFAWMIRRFRLSPTFYFVAAISLLPPLLGLLVNWDVKALQVPTDVTFDEKISLLVGGMKILLKDPVVWLCSLAMFFHFPMEFSIATWGTTLMGDKGVNENQSASILSIFWLTFLVSRLITAFGLPAGYGMVLANVLAVLAIIGVIGLVTSKSATITCFLMIILGAILGPIFPTLIAILVGNTEKDLQGRAIGIFFSLGGIGCTLIPILVGWQAKKTTLQRGFVYVVGCAVALLVLTITLSMNLKDKKAESEKGKGEKVKIQKTVLRLPVTPFKLSAG